MRRFADHNPVAVAAYFLCAAGVCMFSMEPAILAMSLGGAAAAVVIAGEGRKWRVHLLTLLLFFGMALINPLIAHKGVTALFVLNHNPVTLEALLYGVAVGAMIAAVTSWFRAFSALMTSDKLLYIFGSLSPKLALMLSMALRYVPLFGEQARRIQMSQQALGLYREDSLVDRAKGGLRVFSVMVTWTLENGIITADSMAARGYGTGKRSRFSLFRWTLADAALLLLSLALTAVTGWGLAGRAFAYYPAIAVPPLDGRRLIGFICYGLLMLLPTIITGKEAFKWRCLRSKI